MNGRCHEKEFLFILFDRTTNFYLVGMHRLSLVNETKWNAEMGVYGWRAIRLSIATPQMKLSWNFRANACTYAYDIYQRYERANNIAGETLPMWIIFDPAIRERFALKALDLRPRLIFNHVRTTDLIILRHITCDASIDVRYIAPPVVINKYSPRSSISDTIKLQDNEVIFVKRAKNICQHRSTKSIHHL